MSRIATRRASAQDMTFIVDCNRAMAAETEDLGLVEDTLRQGIEYLMAHPREGFYLVAEVDGQAAVAPIAPFEGDHQSPGRLSVKL